MLFLLKKSGANRWVNSGYINTFNGPSIYHYIYQEQKAHNITKRIVLPWEKKVHQINKLIPDQVKQMESKMFCSSVMCACVRACVNSTLRSWLDVPSFLHTVLLSLEIDSWWATNLAKNNTNKVFFLVWNWFLFICIFSKAEMHLL